MNPENFASIKESVQSRGNEIIAHFLGPKNYNQDQVQKWTAQLSEDLVKALKEMAANMKFCVNCLILQKGDAGMHLSSTCYWDSSTDGSATIKWENSSMYCIVNVYGISF